MRRFNFKDWIGFNMTFNYWRYLNNYVLFSVEIVLFYRQLLNVFFTIHSGHPQPQKELFLPLPDVATLQLSFDIACLW